MPAFCVRPKKSPLGLFRSISSVIGRLPAGPDDFVSDLKDFLVGGNSNGSNLDTPSLNQILSKIGN